MSLKRACNSVNRQVLAMAGDLKCPSRSKSLQEQCEYLSIHSTAQGTSQKKNPTRDVSVTLLTECKYMHSTMQQLAITLCCKSMVTALNGTQPYTLCSRRTLSKPCPHHAATLPTLCPHHAVSRDTARALCCVIQPTGYVPHHFPNA